MELVGLPSTFFTAPPEWRWWIVLYFFVGGIAGGSYFLAALIDGFGRPEERALARLGYAIAFAGVLLSGLLLIVDLRRPERFWHMLIESNTGQPMFKSWSPMSFGSWALLVFGAFTFVAVLASLQEVGRLRWPWVARLRPPAPLGRVIAVLGVVMGFFVAGYTGVLLSVTNRPIWADSQLLGLLFLVSGASTAAALLIVLAHWRGRWASGIEALARLDSWVLVLELVVLIALTASLWSIVPRVWFNAWGLLLLLGVVILGILIPLVLERRPHAFATRTVIAAALVLIGGFILRVVLLLSAEAVGAVT
jgi:protein NrfD